MITNLCRKCGKQIKYPATYCEGCKPLIAIRQQQDRHYNRYRRNKQSDTFYHSKEWRALSAYVLSSANYRCAICGGIATEVHHVAPITEAWERRLDVDNLMPLCTVCHNKMR